MKIQSDDKHTINLLWTGGWDSTYRLIDLIHVKKVTVQPYYIIDYERKSTSMELETMQKIKGMIRKLDKEAHERICSLIIIPRFDICEQKNITENYSKLKEKGHIGGQYEWISSFAQQFGFKDLEMCIIFSENTTWEYSLYNNTIKVKSDKIGSYYILNDKSKNTPLSIFRFFRFPILDISKHQIKKEASRTGFYEILEQTWFCHSSLGATPCGVCPPCRYVIEDGLGYRLPKGARLRYRFRKYILWLNEKFDDLNLYLAFKRVIRNSF